MRIGVIIQARTSSTRLPGKVLKELPYGSGITVLEQVIRRVRQATKINEIIIATTEEKDDDIIIEIAKKEKVKYFRGSKEHVLSRYYYAAKEHYLDIVVRVTSDCPCIDPCIIDDIISYHIDNLNDYTSNSLDRTFPHGLDAEVFAVKALNMAYEDSTEVYEKEHVTPYIYKSHYKKFKIAQVRADEGLNRPDIRITLDTENDYILLCAVYDYLYHKNKFFSAEDIVKLFTEKPWIGMINKTVMQKKIFDTLEEEIDEAIKLLNLQDLNRTKVYLMNKLRNGL